MRRTQLQHSSGEAEKFYRDLKLKGLQVRVGMEATGHARWFERLLAEVKYELRVGDPAERMCCKNLPLTQKIELPTTSRNDSRLSGVPSPRPETIGPCLPAKEAS